ncbi:uncharacterized protein LOC132610664 [Lycium barbarum]|uniref:uncharacterized protein LOC132610664 n=1 Tax=Lycium barbarum TaxID=112863 RepID=UPI00293EF992|nr:uncharacterized protein LOC132610664 [Lycium barbarum]XP_060180969.1 uncharacterized protein LOC132610664 [Lycium barbarum]XP_060180970.1 uncharacterized protein LOC132610664 [Lycium barbarum]XP_060180971.1 uncharacterized protein LOC132610664 [Lycium barbarum]XP_060180972.1 uncharacterized protein LOC132610664 [Lycium barbarum]XP_060180973.1 uncharacterized protein LOC132610664 [Lycium barbarum]
METKKSGKLPKTGMAMTCSFCHIRGHNKRGCPLKRSDGINIGSSASIAHDQSAANPLSSTKGRGRPKKTTTTEAEPAIKKRRGRPKKTGDPPSTANKPIVAAEFPSSLTHYDLGSWFECSAPNPTINVAAEMSSRAVGC